MKKLAFFSLFWLLAIAFAQAQSTVNVTGVVTKLADGSPVENHFVYCFVSDSTDPNGVNLFAEGFTDATGAYNIALDVPPGVGVPAQVSILTLTYCQPEFVSTVVKDVVNNAASADFQICEDSFPPPPDCYAEIGVAADGNLTFDFFAFYWNVDSTEMPTFQWTFGDGTASNEENPSHTFLQDGFYVVTLTVTYADGCVATASFPLETSFHGFPQCMGYILYNQTGPTSFDFSADLYDANGTPIQAADYLWDFGDGNISNDPAPSHTYASQGVYTVQLHALTGDSCEIHTCDVLFAMDDPIDTFWYGCQAMFAIGIPWSDSTNWDPNGGGWNSDPLTLSFIDLSLGAATSWFWSFGDGSSSTEQNPTHTYAQGGIYTVSLSIVTLDGCESSATFEICVGDNCWVNEPDCQALFIPLPDSLGGNGIQFIDLSFTSSPITSWTWSFGDGTASNEQNPYHVYSQPGVYPVTLTITADSCNSTITFEIDTESPWNFSSPGSPAQLGVSSQVLATKAVLSNFDAVKVSPNPAQDHFLVSFNSKEAGDYQLNVRDLSGKQMIQQTYQAVDGLNSVRLNAANLTPGLYLVELRSGNDIQTLKLVKQ